MIVRIRLALTIPANAFPLLHGGQAPPRGDTVAALLANMSHGHWKRLVRLGTYVTNMVPQTLANFNCAPNDPFSVMPPSPGSTRPQPAPRFPRRRIEAGKLPKAGLAQFRLTSGKTAFRWMDQTDKTHRTRHGGRI